jgi:glycogen debranching enzyme
MSVKMTLTDLAKNTINGNKKKSNNGELVLLAGKKHPDMWTRDGFIGSLGLLASDCSSDPIKYIETLHKNLRNDGLVPLKIGTGPVSHITRLFFGLSIWKDRPVYRDDKYFSKPTDSNPQYIIILYLMSKRLTGDSRKEFILKHEPRKVMSYIIRKNHTNEDYLVYGHYFNSWYDSFTINGADLYSNVLFGYSMKCYIKLLRDVEDSVEILYVTVYYEHFLKRFRENFMKDNGLLKIHKDIDSVETVSNALAVLFDLLKPDQNNKIVEYLYEESKKGPLPVVRPRLKWNLVYFPLYLICFQGYHNDRTWPWVNFIVLTVLKKYKKDCHLLEEMFDKYITKHGTFYEVLNNDLSPYWHPIQKSDSNFTKSAGSYLLFKNFDNDLFS